MDKTRGAKTATKKDGTSSDRSTRVPSSLDGAGGRGYREKYDEYLRRPMNSKVVLHLGRAGTQFGIGAALQTDYSPVVLTRHFMPFRGYRRLAASAADPFGHDPAAGATVGVEDQQHRLLLVDPNRVAPARGSDQQQTPFFDLGWGFEASREKRDELLNVRRACLGLYTGLDGTLSDLRESVAIPEGTTAPDARPDPDVKFHSIVIREPSAGAPPSPPPLLLCTALCNRYGMEMGAGRGFVSELPEAFRHVTCVSNGGAAYLNEPRVHIDAETGEPIADGADARKTLRQYRMGVSHMAAGVAHLRMACNLYAFEMWERSVLTACGLPEVEDAWKKTTPGKECGGDVTDFEHAAMTATCLALWGEPCFDPTRDGAMYLEEQPEPAMERHRAGTALMVEVLLQFNAYGGTMRGKASRRHRAVASAQVLERRTRDIANALREAAPAAADRFDAALARLEAEPSAEEVRAAAVAPGEASRKTFRDRVHERASALAGAMMCAAATPGDGARRAYGTLAKLRAVDMTLQTTVDDATAAALEAELARVSALTRGLAPGRYPGGLLYDVAYDRCGSCAQ